MRDGNAAPVIVEERTSLPLLLLLIYFPGTILTIFNYAFYVRFHDDDYYTLSIKNAYLVFTVLGPATYLLFSAVCWVWAAKYTQSETERFSKMGYGLWGVFLLHDCPMIFIEMYMVLEYGGFRNGLQTTVFFFHWALFATSFLFGWVTYSFEAAGYLERSFGTSGLKTGREKIMILPTRPRSPEEPLAEPFIRRSLEPERLSPGRQILQTRWSPREPLPLREEEYYLPQNDRMEPVPIVLPIPRMSDFRPSSSRSPGSIYVERNYF